MTYRAHVTLQGNCETLEDLIEIITRAQYETAERGWEFNLAEPVYVILESDDDLPDDES